MTKDGTRKSSSAVLNPWVVCVRRRNRFKKRNRTLGRKIQTRSKSTKMTRRRFVNTAGLAVVALFVLPSLVLGDTLAPTGTPKVSCNASS